MVCESSQSRSGPKSSEKNESDFCREIADQVSGLEDSESKVGNRGDHSATDDH